MVQVTLKDIPTDSLVVGNSARHREAAGGIGDSVAPQGSELLAHPGPRPQQPDVAIGKTQTGTSDGSLNPFAIVGDRPARCQMPPHPAMSRGRSESAGEFARLMLRDLILSVGWGLRGGRHTGAGRA